MWFLESLFAGASSMILHQVIGYGLIALLLAVAWFSPVFKKDFIYAAIIVGVALFFEQVGVHDEAKHAAAQEQVIEKHVEQAVTKSKSSKVRHAKDPWNDPKN